LFEVDVVSDPSFAYATSGALPNEHYQSITSYDESLVKPALLVADSVRLVTIRNDIVRFETANAFENSRMPMRYILAFAYLSVNRHPEDLAALGLTEHNLADPVDAHRLVDADEKIEPLQAFAKKYGDRIHQYQVAFARVLRRRVADLRSEGLVRAGQLGLLQEVTWHGGDYPIEALAWKEGQEEYLAAALAGVTERIASAHGSVLLEPGAMHSLSKHRQRDGDKSNDDAQKLLDLSAGVASVVTGQIPGLAEMPVSEVLDLRTDLKDYLAPFRAEMAKLSDEIAEASVSIDELEREVKRRWVREIDPALSDLRAEVGRGAYRRNLLGAFAEDKASMASAGSSVALGVGSIAAGLGALIPAVAAGAYPFVRALNETLRARDEARKNRLYFLYKAQQRSRRYS
jgi:hypothetical protein